MSEESGQVLKAVVSLPGMGQLAQSQDSHSLGQLCELSEKSRKGSKAAVYLRSSSVFLNLFTDPALQD